MARQRHDRRERDLGWFGHRRRVPRRPAQTLAPGRADTASPRRRTGTWPSIAAALWVVGALGALTALGTLGTAVVPASGAAAQASPTTNASSFTTIETEPVAAGVDHTELVWQVEGRPVVGDLLEVDLRHPRVSVDLLYSGAVADRRPVSQLADSADAVAAVNGDFFNINETNAPVGPAVADGRALKAAVPAGQRYGPGAPGLSTEDVFAVGRDRVGRIDRLTLRGAALTEDGPLALHGLNQYAISVDGIGAFTSEWGTASRRRATCGTDTDRSAPCSQQTTEVAVERGIVTAVRDTPGSGAIPRGGFVLVGREDGATALRQQLEVGDEVAVHFDLVRQGRSVVEAAAGGVPILRDGQPITGLDDTALAPRTTAGVSEDGRHLYLLTVDGRSTASQGLTLDELAQTIHTLGADDAVNLDGGGSSTLVAREPDADQVTVQNVPSDGAQRPVPNALGIFVAGT